MEGDFSIKGVFENELPEVAAKLTSTFPGNRIFAFYGEMGAGKTTFIKVICKLLGVDEVVNSPTFAIINVYKSKSGDVFHFDFYRLKSVNELFDIGYEEYFYSGSWCFIEWPEKIEEFLPEDTIRVKINIDQKDGSREFVV